jgi:hypothetical protein
MWCAWDMLFNKNKIKPVLTLGYAVQQLTKNKILSKKGVGTFNEIVKTLYTIKK